MIRAGATLLCLAMTPALAAAQVGCLPPEEPFAYEPPKDDPELRALIDAQYQDYIRGTETYLNCLNAEFARARADYQKVTDRYHRYFGDDAALTYDAPG